MTTESLACNSCGAPIAVPSGVQFATCGHCGASLRIHRETSVHYTEALERVAQAAEATQRELRQLRLQNELEQLDREWEAERQSYLVSNKYGQKNTPSRTGAIIILVIGVPFALFWIAVAVGIAGGAHSIGAPGFISGPASLFPCFGVLFLLLLVGGAVLTLKKAGQHETGEQRYQRRRQELLARMAEDRRPQQ